MKTQTEAEYRAAMEGGETFRASAYHRARRQQILGDIDDGVRRQVIADHLGRALSVVSNVVCKMGRSRSFGMRRLCRKAMAARVKRGTSVADVATAFRVTPATVLRACRECDVPSPRHAGGQPGQRPDRDMGK